jgi:hypothetical protein
MGQTSGSGLMLAIRRMLRALRNNGFPTRLSGMMSRLMGMKRHAQERIAH